MSDDRQIFIHAGAHRTGTSSFQQCLAQNRSQLASLGFTCAYPGRDGVAGGRLKLPLPRKRHGAHRVPRFAEELARHLGRIAPPKAGHLILSEENIPGLMRNFYDGLFMAGSRNRLAALREGLGQAPRHVLYVIRPYAPLFVSAYRKRAEDNLVPGFETLRQTLIGIDRGWSAVVRDLQEGLGAEKVTIVDYSKRGSSVALLGRLVPDLAQVDLVEPDWALNLSATDAALHALQKLYQMGEKLERAAWQEVIAAHADDKTPRGFAEFTSKQIETFQTRYADDLEKISDMPGVTLIA